MGSMWSGANREEIEMALIEAKQIVSSNPVVVFRVKQLFSQLGISYKLLELDRESDGSKIQTALAEWTGQRTVPNVFIGGKHMGGSDDVMKKHQTGKLVPLLTEASAVAKNSAQL